MKVLFESGDLVFVECPPQKRTVKLIDFTGGKNYLSTKMVRLSFPYVYFIIRKSSFAAGFTTDPITKEDFSGECPLKMVHSLDFTGNICLGDHKIYGRLTANYKEAIDQYWQSSFRVLSWIEINFWVESGVCPLKPISGNHTDKYWNSWLDIEWLRTLKEKAKWD